MNRELATQVANTVLYQGYMLYPYRPSPVKNRQRWRFGIMARTHGAIRGMRSAGED